MPQNDETKTWDSVKEGLRFVFRTKEILAAFSLDMFAVLFGGAVAMVPVFAKDILKIGPMGFGWLNAAIDIGSIFIVVLLAFFPLKKAQGKKLMIAVAGFGICIILFALSKWFVLSFAALIIRRNAGRHQCGGKRYGYAIKDPGPYAGAGQQRRFYVHQLK